MPHAIAIVDLRDNFYSICMYLMFTDILFAIYIFNQKKRFQWKIKIDYMNTWPAYDSYHVYAYCLKFSTK